MTAEDYNAFLGFPQVQNNHPPTIISSANYCVCVTHYGSTVWDPDNLKRQSPLM